MEKSWENFAKTLPNPSPNLPKSIEKPSENAKKRNFEASCEKNAKKCDLGANLERTWRPKAKKILCPTGYATPSQRSFAPPKGMGRPEQCNPTHEGYETPAHCLRSARPAEAATNFERPFTPRTSLRSPRNFGNARFRRFANFDFSTPKKKKK